MRFLPLLLVLSSLPALAQAGTVQLSPAKVTVENSQSSEDITLSYTPTAGARDFEVSVSIGLERLGWSRVEAVPSPATGVKVVCALTGGQVRALVFAPAGGSLPATTLALCRLRVRPHAHSPDQTWYSIATSYAYETDASFNLTQLNNAWGWVLVP
jgi:hypothetical protein